MPEIARFEGIIITIFYNDHEPPHFHIKKGSESAKLSIPELEVLNGTLSSNTLKTVIKWANEFMSELENNWQLAKDKKPLNKIN